MENCLRVLSIELLTLTSSPIPADIIERQNWILAMFLTMDILKSLPQFELPCSLIGATNPLLFSLALGPRISC